MWQIILGVGIIFLLLEIFIPSMFFINFALAAGVCAVVSLFYQSIFGLVIIFSILSLIFIFVLRPIFQKKLPNEEKTGIEEKYIGKIAKAIEDINKDNGAISIYDERWQARNIDDSIIEKGSNVKIIKNESLIMIVQKID